MKCVRKYETTDGKLFDTQNEAHNHEIKMEIRSKITNLFHPEMSTNRADALVMAMTNNPKNIRDILNELIRKTRKTEEVEV